MVWNPVFCVRQSQYAYWDKNNAIFLYAHNYHNVVRKIKYQQCDNDIIWCYWLSECSYDIKNKINIDINVIKINDKRFEVFEMNKNLLTVEEICSELGIGKTKAYKLIKEGILSSGRIGKRIIVPKAELDKYIDQVLGKQMEWLRGGREMFENMPEILDLKQCQKELRLGRNSMLELLRNGDIKAFKLKGSWKIPKTSLIEYVKRFYWWK